LFVDTDRKNALETVDYWIDTVAKGRSNVDPEQIPWQAIRRLLGQTIYGGRIDNPFDQRLLDSFLDQLFTARSYDADTSIVNTPRAGRDNLVIAAPEAHDRAGLMKWIENLPNKDSPSWLGLPDNAELLLLQGKGVATLQKLLKMQTLDEDDDSSEDFGEEHSKAEESADTRPQWARHLLDNLTLWKQLVAGALTPLEKKPGSETNPLIRFFDREVSSAITLVGRVRRDLDQVGQVCTGDLKQTNYLRALINNLTKGVIPPSWQKEYVVSESTSLNHWFRDLAKRIQHLEEAKRQLADLGEKPLRIWLGGLFNPEAFITATRQRAARSNKWSLESLILDVEVLDTPDKEAAAMATSRGDSFVVEGLQLQGAQWANGLALSTEMIYKLPRVRLAWKTAPADSVGETKGAVQLPVYLNETRKQLLFAADFAAPESIAPTVWFQRGVAIAATNI
jgi:dynein heavy chain 1